MENRTIGNHVKHFYLVIVVILFVVGASALDIRSSEALEYYNDGSLEFQVDQTGQISAYNDLDMQGNAISGATVDSSSSVVDGAIPDVDTLSYGGRFAGNQVPWGSVDQNLDMNGNDISSFFASECGSGQAVVQVYSDGGYQCMDVSQEVAGDYVNRSGDSMTGDLDMSGDDVLDIGDLTGSGIVNSGQIASNAVGSSELGTLEGQVTSEIDGNDVWTVRDGSGGDNNSPYTFRFDQPRDLRWWSDNAGTVIEMDHNGDVGIPSGDLSLSGTLTSGTVPTARLDQDSISIGSGNHLTGGGTVSLGGSTGLDVDAGSVLGSANDLDSSGNIQSGTVGGDELTSSYETGAAYDGRFVNSDGDSMSGSLDMSSNTIDYVGRLNFEDATSRIHFDRDQTGSSFYIQRESTTAETYLTIEDEMMSIGKGISSPSSKVDMGELRVNDGGPVEVAGSDLDLNNNQLQNVGGTDCGSEEVLTGDGGCAQNHDYDYDYHHDDLGSALDHGNTASRDIDMSGNDIRNVEKIESQSGIIHESTSTNTLDSGWYTIADNSGNRASAKFIIRETESGSHQTTHFHAANHYGNSNTINVLSDSHYSGGGCFEHIRIKDAGTYDGAMLQVYVDSSCSGIQAFIMEDFQNDGWTLRDWEPGDTISGLSEAVRVTTEGDNYMQSTDGFKGPEGEFTDSLRLPVGTDQW